ncbi:MAG: tail fiber domain-containing protein [Anderseniella sp.]
MFEVNTATQRSPEPPISDMRVKRDIVPVGELENGLTLYRFKYNWGEREFVGVMAQDVLKVHPDAVSVTENGLYDVDYTMIGAKFMTYENWLQQSKQSPLERMQAAKARFEDSPEPMDGDDKPAVVRFHSSPEPVEKDNEKMTIISFGHRLDH